MSGYVEEFTLSRIFQITHSVAPSAEMQRNDSAASLVMPGQHIAFCQIHQGLWSHMSGKIVENSSLEGKPKTQWLKTQKNRLYRSDIGFVVIAIQKLVSKKPSKDQTTRRNYFENHRLVHSRMDYSMSVSNHLPIGSGAIECAVRRVINLRAKSNSTYWLRENAETIIRFRA